MSHEIKTMKVPSPDVCEVNCFIEPNCVSFNVVLLRDGTLECQLSDSDHNISSGDMIYEVEASYTSVVVSNKKYQTIFTYKRHWTRSELFSSLPRFY